MKPVRAGDLRHVVTLQYPALSAPNSLGERTTIWTTAFTGIRAAIWPQSGKEFLAQNSEITSKIDTKIRIRYHSGVLSSWRVVWGSRIFEIAAVIQPDMRPIYLDLMCYEIRTGATKPAPTGA